MKDARLFTISGPYNSSKQVEIKCFVYETGLFVGYRSLAGLKLEVLFVLWDFDSIGE
jgi:hypothetical protein